MSKPRNYPIPLSETVPEIELLLACARTQPDSETTQNIRRLVESGIDWEYMLAISEHHCVLPMVYRSLNTICPDLIPAETLNELRRYFLANSQDTLLLTAELVKMMELFKENDIKAVPYKGAVLAAAVYGNVGLRQFIDLDILIRKQDILKAKHLIVKHGYYPLKERTPEQEQELLKSNRHYDYILLRNDDRFKVELHWAFARWYFPFALDPASLWERTENVPLVGKNCPSLLPEDLFLILTVHGAKHRWEQLKWICDIAEMTREKGDSVNWERLLSRAKELRVKRIVLLGLLLSNRLLGTKLPAIVEREIKGDSKTLEYLVELTRKVLFRGVYSPLKDFERYSFYLSMRENRLDRLRYFLFLAQRLTPNRKDEEFADLPQSLSFLSYIVRPFRLAREYGISSVKHLFGITQPSHHKP